MKVSFKWLKEYIDADLRPADVADRLTKAGIEVEGMQVIGGNWDNIVVGQILAVSPHPNADRLSLATIDLGTEQRTVVCGAPNLRTSDKVAFAYAGAQLVDGHSGQLYRLRPAKIRGVLSDGMACSEKELGISDSHEGILVLPEEAPVGTPLADYLGDTIFSLEVTPNRPDCLSVVGIAREVAALTGHSLHIPEIKYEEATLPADQQVSVTITAPELCPRYCASLINGIKVASSPEWMQQRLLACGLRPINNIVDVTNYVMLEHGQPLHAFDYHRIEGKRIIVRRAAGNEGIVSLDGVERTLSENMLVIADSRRAVAIAGIMGGADSEVAPETTSILLEAANFNPASVHYTGRTLQLPSEACLRFERGIRPELTLPAIRRATQLIVELAGGEAASGIVDVYPGQLEPEPILLSAGKVKRLLGVDFGLDRIMEELASLGFDCDPAGSGSEVRVTPPYWRSDIQLAEDLIEEVARITGYDKIPSTMLSQPIPRQNPAPLTKLKHRVRLSLTGCGFQELVTFSLTSLDMLKRVFPEPQTLDPMPIRMANPMTADQEYLRSNLRAGLLAALSANRRYEGGGIRVYELGRIYMPRPGDLPAEPEIVCGILSGPRYEKSWYGGHGSFGFFDAKGVATGLLEQLGLEPGFEKSSDTGLHPNKQAAVIIAGSRVGVIGELHPGVSQAFEISEAVSLFEIDLTALIPFTSGYKRFQPVPRFPAVVRDMALVVDAGIPHQQVQDIIKGFPLVSEVSVFDVYAGDQVPAGKKSLAYSVTFQSLSYTLTDEEVNKVEQQILGELFSKLGATLRT